MENRPQLIQRIQEDVKELMSAVHHQSPSYFLLLKTLTSFLVKYVESLNSDSNSLSHQVFGHVGDFCRRSSITSLAAAVLFLQSGNVLLTVSRMYKK